MTDPKVEIYLGTTLGWTDITAYTASVRSQLAITRGRQDEQRQAEPSRCTFALNNRDGRFSPRNPVGPYYGVIGRNTQCRVSVAGTGYRFWGEISEWPPTWDQSHQDVWTSVTAQGILRRLGQGAPPLAGPITRFATSPAAVQSFGYWPMTDPVGSTTLASQVTGVAAMAIDGTATPKLASDSSSFPTSDPLPVLNGASFRGVPAVTSGAAYTYFLTSVPLAGDTNDAVLLRLLVTGTSNRWELRYFSAGGGQLSLRAFDISGATLLSTALAFALNGVPSVVQVNLIQSGGNINYGIVVTAFSTGVSTTVVGTLVGYTLGYTYQVQFNADRALLNTSVGHFNLSAADPGAFITAFRGFIGETAGRRVQRLCAEESIPLVTVGDLDATEPMGLQLAGAFLDLLAKCEAADMGYLYEPRDSFGLAYRTRGSLYGQATDLALAYTSVANLQPTEDDQQTRNDVIVTRKFGSSARTTVTSGPLSVQAPPNGVGRYQDSLTLSLASDTQLQYQADWRAARGTIDEPRYPTIGVDLVKVGTGPAAVDVGDLITVSGTPVWVPPAGIKALAIGYTETFFPTSGGPWTIDFNCVPATPFDDAFTLDSATLGRLDSDGSVTAGTLTTTATTVAYTGGDWITTAAYPAEFPFDIVITGEQMTVTAGVAGSLTVVRSVNGVVKTHAAGEPIRLNQPNRLVL